MKNFLFVLVAMLPCQAFAQVQQNVIVIFDDSTSMTTKLGNVSRMEAAKQSLTKVLTNLPDNTNIGIVTLNTSWEESKWYVPFGPINKKTIGQNINKVVPNGGTPLGGCMKAATDVLLSKRAKQKYGNYRLLIVTDGEAGDANLVEQYTPDIMTRGLSVDVIGVGMKGEHTLATKVTSYKKANDPKQLAVALQATFAEVSYKDKAAADEDFRMLAALPDNFAPKVIEALQNSGNQPIGQKVVDNGNDNGGTLVSFHFSGSAAPVVMMVFFGVVVLAFFVLE